MEDFGISLICGLVAFAIVMYAMFKAFKRLDKIQLGIAWICSKLKIPEPDFTSSFWGLAFQFIFLFVVVGCARTFFEFMNWITSLRG